MSRPSIDFGPQPSGTVRPVNIPIGGEEDDLTTEEDGTLDPAPPRDLAPTPTSAPARTLPPHPSPLARRPGARPPVIAIAASLMIVTSLAVSAAALLAVAVVLALQS